ncbi:hypothetical protein L208DRAFT_1412134 [Tricholoma matsutake]|nr:hypothetical protein L208DRAFT_1412134 [Tricholoma matsutake 945]
MIVDGTKVGFGWLKKLNSMQIFVPQCCFSRFGSPTMLQCMRAPQSRHSAYPCASRTA